MRSLREISAEVKQHWKKVSPHAEPYLAAMAELDSVEDKYYFENGDDIVRRFLINASGWRGEKARSIKAELRAMIGE